MHTQTLVSSSHRLRAAVVSFFATHPVLSSVLLFIAFVVISTLSGLTARKILPQFQPEFVALIPLSALIAITLSALNWWKAAGFNASTEWRASHLIVVPFLIVLGLPFLMGSKITDPGTFLYLAVAYALTGFMEEGLMRGMVLHILKPTGVTRSIVLSSLLFGLMHIGNLLYRNPFIVLAQIIGAFVHGIGLGAIRLRTNTIWFPVLLHALHDLALKYTNFPVIPLDVVQVTLLMVYGVYLLKDWKQAGREAVITADAPSAG